MELSLLAIINKNNWQKQNVELKLLHSVAGLATQILVTDLKDNVHLLLDIGDGTTRDLVDHQISIHNLQIIVISHGHYDHCSGLHSLLGFMRMLGRTSDLHIIYPANAVEIMAILAAFLASYSNTIPFNISHHIVNADGKEPEALRIGSWIIYPHWVNHRGSTLKYGTGDVIPALGYRITRGDINIAYSGDTGPCESLAKLFTENIDLGILEATYPTITYIKDLEPAHRYHLTEEEARFYGNVCAEYMLIHKLHKSALKQL